MVALVHPGHLRLSISTSNASPALSSRLRQDLEEIFAGEFAAYLDGLAEARQRVRAKVADRETRFALLRSLVSGFRLEGMLRYPADWKRHVDALMTCELEFCGTEREVCGLSVGKLSWKGPMAGPKNCQCNFSTSSTTSRTEPSTLYAGEKSPCCDNSFGTASTRNPAFTAASASPLRIFHDNTGLRF